MNPETIIQNQVRLAATKAGSRMFRNQVGVAEIRGCTVRFGLCNGSSDLIGWTPRIYAGRQVAVFTAIEIKTASGRTTDEQERFLEAVRQAGGLAGVARSTEEAIAILQGD
jgi:hypothetical protein